MLNLNCRLEFCLLVKAPDNQQLSKYADVFVYNINDRTDHISSIQFLHRIVFTRRKKTALQEEHSAFLGLSLPECPNELLRIHCSLSYTRSQLRNRLPLYKTCLCVCPLARSTIIRSIVSNILTTLGRRPSITVSQFFTVVCFIESANFLRFEYGKRAVVIIFFFAITELEVVQAGF